jgi:hypothetical protein
VEKIDEEGSQHLHNHRKRRESVKERERESSVHGIGRIEEFGMGFVSCSSS